MAAALEKKTPIGRKRKYPEGSMEHRLKVPPHVQGALNKYIERQDVPPEDGTVILVALKRFLIDQGDLKDE